MRKMNDVRALSLTVLAASLAVAFGPAAAEQNEEVARLVRPDSQVQLGLGYLTDDAARFGQYTGLRETGMYAIGNFDLVRRDDATGTWLRYGGRNLGLESRELRAEHERQGDWRYSLEYNKIPRYSQYEVNTSLVGVNDDMQTVLTPADPRFDYRLSTKREGVTLAGQKSLGNGLNLQVKFKNETKEGGRLFGYYPGGNPYFLVEPIDHTMRQIDVILGYTGKNLQLSGGYYGSFFKNEDRALSVSRITDAATGARGIDVLALAPDNEAHQLYLNGGYTFTPTTRANFKLAKGVGLQNETFAQPATQGAMGRRDLDGRLETTLVQMGLSSRPMQKLSLLANYKYEDRDDETPVRQYFARPGPTNNTFNEPRSLRTHNGKLEANYLLPADFRVVGGVDYEKRDRNVFATRHATYREETEETSYRVELRRALSDTVNGSIAYVNSERDGSSFLRAGAVLPAGPVAPAHLADRDREKVRVRLDWAPLEALSLQALGDVSDDEYSGGNLGLDEGKATFLSLDASYKVNESWQALAWVSRESTRMRNDSTWGSSRDAVEASVAKKWSANFKQRSEAAGLGFRGTLGERVKVGGDYQYSHERSRYDLSGNLGTAVEPPDVKYRLNTVKLFAEYEVRRDLSMRVDVVHDRWKTNDWLWNYAFRSDGTTLSQDDSQDTTFVGMSVRYAFR